MEKVNDSYKALVASYNSLMESKGVSSFPNPSFGFVGPSALKHLPLTLRKVDLASVRATVSGVCY